MDENNENVLEFHIYYNSAWDGIQKYCLAKEAIRRAFPQAETVQKQQRGDIFRIIAVNICGTKAELEIWSGPQKCQDNSLSEWRSSIQPEIERNAKAKIDTFLLQQQNSKQWQIS